MKALKAVMVLNTGADECEIRNFSRSSQSHFEIYDNLLHEIKCSNKKITIVFGLLQSFYIYP